MGAGWASASDENENVGEEGTCNENVGEEDTCTSDEGCGEQDINPWDDKPPGGYKRAAQPPALTSADRLQRNVFAPGQIVFARYCRSRHAERVDAFRFFLVDKAEAEEYVQVFDFGVNEHRTYSTRCLYDVFVLDADRVMQILRAAEMLIRKGVRLHGELNEQA